MLSQVSAVAERIVGGAIAADASLMQAGLDSLGSVDLRRELAAALQLGTALHINSLHHCTDI
jgi:Phosphopantetheine attachment site